MPAECWIDMRCRHCGAPGQLPVRDGQPLKRLCWRCDDALWREGEDWVRSPLLAVAPGGP